MLDLILTNRPNNVLDKNVVIHGLSDHRLVYVVSKHVKPKTPARIIHTRAYRRLNITLFCEALLNARMEIMEGNDIEIERNNWKTKFVGICDEHCPKISLRVRGRKTKWVTPEYTRLCSDRDALRKKAENSKDRRGWSLLDPAVTMSII